MIWLLGPVVALLYLALVLWLWGRVQLGIVVMVGRGYVGRCPACDRDGPFLQAEGAIEACRCGIRYELPAYEAHASWLRVRADHMKQAIRIDTVGRIGLCPSCRNEGRAINRGRGRPEFCDPCGRWFWVPEIGSTREGDGKTI